MTLEMMHLTRHVREERMGRVEYIQKNIGFGETVRCIKQANRKGFKCLTDTGIMVIRDEYDMRVMITCYVATISQARSMYPDGTLPHWLFERVLANVRAGHVEMNHILTVEQEVELTNT